MSRVRLGGNLGRERVNVDRRIQDLRTPAANTRKQALLTALEALATGAGSGDVLLNTPNMLSAQITTAIRDAIAATGITGVRHDEDIMERAIYEESAEAAQTIWRRTIQPYFDRELTNYETAITNLVTDLGEVQQALQDLDALLGTPILQRAAARGAPSASIPVPAIILPLEPYRNDAPTVNALLDVNALNTTASRAFLRGLQTILTNADRADPNSAELQRIVTTLSRLFPRVTRNFTARNTAYQNILGQAYNNGNITSDPDRYNPQNVVQDLYGNVDTHLNNILPPEHPDRIEIEQVGNVYHLHVQDRNGARAAIATNPGAFQNWLLTHEPTNGAANQAQLARNYVRTHPNVIAWGNYARNHANIGAGPNIITDIITSGFAGDFAKIPEYSTAFMSNGAVAESDLYTGGGIPYAATTPLQRSLYAAALFDTRTDDPAATQANARDGMTNLLTTNLNNVATQLQVRGGNLHRAIPGATRPANPVEECALIQFAVRGNPAIAAPLQAYALAQAGAAYTAVTPAIIAATAVIGAHSLDELARATVQANLIAAGGLFGLPAGATPLQQTTRLFELARHYNIAIPNGSLIDDIEELVRDAIAQDILNRLPGTRLGDLPTLRANEALMRANYARNLGTYIPNIINVGQGAATEANVIATRGAHITARAELTTGIVLDHMTNGRGGVQLDLTNMADRVEIANIIITNVLEQRNNLMDETRTQYTAFQTRTPLRTNLDTLLANNRMRYTQATLGVGAAGLVTSVFLPVVAPAAAIAFAGMTGYGAWRGITGGAKRVIDLFRSRRNRTPETLRGVQTAPNTYALAGAMNPDQYRNHVATQLATYAKTDSHVEGHPDVLRYTNVDLVDADRARMMQEILTEINTGVGTGVPRETILENVITNVLHARENQLFARVEREKVLQRRWNIAAEAIGGVAGIGAFYGAYGLFNSITNGIRNFIGWNPTPTPPVPPAHPINFHVPNDPYSIQHYGNPDPGLFQILQKDGFTQSDIARMQTDGTWAQFLRDNPVMQGRSATGSGGAHLTGLNLIIDNENLNGQALAAAANRYHGTPLSNFANLFQHR